MGNGERPVTTREEFLAQVRERLAEGIPENVLRPVGSTPSKEPIRYTVDLSNPERRFVEAATAVGAEIAGSSSDELAAVLHRVCADVRPLRAVVSDDPECEGVSGMLRSMDVEVLPAGDSAVTATADLGVTGALTGIALTGSLVIDTGRARTRLASLLPEVHLALLRRDRILPAAGDLLRDMARFFPEGLPSGLLFVTGPSRSADIELEITIGVHGPRRLLIALR